MSPRWMIPGLPVLSKKKERSKGTKCFIAGVIEYCSLQYNHLVLCFSFRIPVYPNSLAAMTSYYMLFFSHLSVPSLRGPCANSCQVLLSSPCCIGYMLSSEHLAIRLLIKLIKATLTLQLLLKVLKGRA